MVDPSPEVQLAALHVLPQVILRFCGDTGLKSDLRANILRCLHHASQQQDTCCLAIMKAYPTLIQAWSVSQVSCKLLQCLLDLESLLSRVAVTCQLHLCHKMLQVAVCDCLSHMMGMTGSGHCQLVACLRDTHTQIPSGCIPACI